MTTMLSSSSSAEWRILRNDIGWHPGSHGEFQYHDGRVNHRHNLDGTITGRIGIKENSIDMHVTYPAQGQYDKAFPPKTTKCRELDGERVYVSGPMRGYPELNRQSFNEVSAVLKDHGADVFSPADKVNTGEHSAATPYDEAIRLDIQMLLESTGICLLPGWQASEGARFEVEVAKNLGLKFYRAEVESGVWIYKASDVPTEGAEGIDQEARRLVYGDRAATYGHPRGDFAIIAKHWTATLLPYLKEGYEITGDQVALMMASLKLARLAKTPTHRDSQVDAIGYLLCLARLQEDPAEMAAWESRSEIARGSNDNSD
jgi:Domain of unknown function (DUF4406)/Domain of unknown function (DUF6378)